MSYGNTARTGKAVGSRVGRSTTGEEVNNIKVIKVSDEACQKVRSCYKEHVRKCDLCKLLNTCRTVNTAGLVEILRNVHKNTGRHKHYVGNTNPDVDDDEQDLGCHGVTPQRPYICAGKSLGQEVVGNQQVADKAALVKEVLYVKKRYELGNSNGHNENGTPELLQHDSLLINKHSNHHTEEVVGEGCEECPGNCPDENITECLTKIGASVKEASEVLKAHPLEETGHTVVKHVLIVTVVGEGDKNHVDNGKNGKERNTYNGESKKSLVELVVKERLEILLTASELLAAGGDVNAKTALLHLKSPCVNESNDENNREKTVEENSYRVVTGNGNGLLEDLAHVLNLLKALGGSYGTYGFAGLEELALLNPIESAALGQKHINDENNLEQKEQKATHYLTVENVTKSEDEEGKLYRPVTLHEGVTDVLNLLGKEAAKAEEQAPYLQQSLLDPAGNKAEEELDVVPESLKLA